MELMNSVLEPEMTGRVPREHTEERHEKDPDHGLHAL